MSSTHNQPTVSVIIPAYNQGPMLARAIESALGQTYPHVEVIVVNDGSTDPITRETAHAYADHIHYIERENGGVAAARNTGINASAGELIAWLDQDDSWLPQKLEVEVAALQAHPHVALVHSSYYHIDAEGRRMGGVHLREGEWYALPDLLVEGTICTSSTLIPKNILTENGCMDPELNGADDWDLYLRLAARGYHFYRVAEPLAEYRLHADNTARKPDLMITVWLRMLDKFYALPNLPKVALRWRGRAYFQKHAAAAALYYGAGRLDEASIHLQGAARHHPEGVATGRFLQSLIYSKSEQPSWADVQETLRFVDSSLRGTRLNRRIARKLEAQQWLVRALHAGNPRRVRGLQYIGRALFTDPGLLIDRELWGAGRRMLARAASRLR